MQSKTQSHKMTGGREETTKKQYAPTSINSFISLKLLTLALDIEPFSDKFLGP